jgi:indolepyruvate ferredoxin oxidoreductase
VVSDEPGKYAGKGAFPVGASFHHRDEMDALQRELRDVPGVSVLIYDQACAAEKRRRRKRGTYPDPAKRVFINDAVCERWIRNWAASEKSTSPPVTRIIPA